MVQPFKRIDYLKKDLKRKYINLFESLKSILIRADFMKDTKVSYSKWKEISKIDAIWAHPNGHCRYLSNSKV